MCESECSLWTALPSQQYPCRRSPRWLWPYFPRCPDTRTPCDGKIHGWGKSRRSHQGPWYWLFSLSWHCHSQAWVPCHRTQAPGLVGHHDPGLAHCLSWADHISCSQLPTKPLQFQPKGSVNSSLTAGNTRSVPISPSCLFTFEVFQALNLVIECFLLVVIHPSQHQHLLSLGDVGLSQKFNAKVSGDCFVLFFRILWYFWPNLEIQSFIDCSVSHLQSSKSSNFSWLSAKSSLSSFRSKHSRRRLSQSSVFSASMSNSSNAFSQIPEEWSFGSDSWAIAIACFSRLTSVISLPR